MSRSDEVLACPGQVTAKPERRAGTQESRTAAPGSRLAASRRPEHAKLNTLACQLICVDPAQVHEFWPHVASLIKAAMEKGRLSSFTDVEHAVRNGRALLWLAWNGETVKAAAVTELSQANAETFCTIVACGGHDRAQWLPLLAELEAYGRAQGCAAMRIYGRRGWRKLLPEYRTTRVLLEKELVTHRHPRA
jgi:hypothetical protein